jgi:hypothetical protein
MAEETNGKITFTTKELLADISTRLSAIDIKLDTKANVVDLVKVITDVGELKSKFLVIDTQKKDVKESRSTQLQSKAIWIPVIANSIGIVVLIYFTVIR